MRHITLTDHAGDQIRQAEQIRKNAYEEKLRLVALRYLPMIRRIAYLEAKAAAASQDNPLLS